MPVKTVSPRVDYVHPDDPAGWLKPDEPFIVDGLDWSWAFVWYKEIDGSPGYCVGTNGTVWSRRRKVGLGFGYGCKSVLGEIWNRLKTPISNHYQVVTTSSTGTRPHTTTVHRLVLETFIGPRPHGKECLHRDDNPTNNRLSNLRWGTAAENHQDAVRNNQKGVGERNGRARLTEYDIVEIRERFTAGSATHSELSAIYGVNTSMISHITTGRCWPHVAGPILLMSQKRPRASREVAREVRSLAASGMDNRSICKKFGLGDQTVYRIIRGVSHTQ